jgi:hypothetical protein
VYDVVPTRVTHTSMGTGSGRKVSGAAYSISWRATTAPVSCQSIVPSRAA